MLLNLGIHHKNNTNRQKEPKSNTGSRESSTKSRYFYSISFFLNEPNIVFFIPYDIIYPT